MVETALLNLTCTSDDKVFTYQIVKNTPFVVQDFLLFNPERFLIGAFFIFSKRYILCLSVPFAKCIVFKLNKDPKLFVNFLNA